MSTDLERLSSIGPRRIIPGYPDHVAGSRGTDSGRLDAVLRAAQVLGVEAVALDHALEQAETSGLLRVELSRAVVSFVHPLMRSAIYRGATTARRQEVERALGGVLDAEVDADRRAWHLANAAAGPDAEVAYALQGAAERARARGGHAAAAAAFDRAAALTAGARAGAARLAGAATAAWLAGQPDRARALLDRAAALPGAPRAARPHRASARVDRRRTVGRPPRPTPYWSPDRNR